VPLSWSQQASLLSPPGPIAPLTISRLDAVLTGGDSHSVFYWATALTLQRLGRR